MIEITVRIEGYLPSSIEAVKPSDQNVSGFVRELLRRSFEREWLSESDRADLAEATTGLPGNICRAPKRIRMVYRIETRYGVDFDVAAFDILRETMGTRGPGEGGRLGGFRVGRHRSRDTKIDLQKT